MFFWLRFNEISSLTLLLLRLKINEFPAYGVSWFAFKIESPVSRDLIWLYHCKMNCTRLIWIWCDSLYFLDSNYISSTSAMKVHLLIHSLIRLKRTVDIYQSFFMSNWVEAGHLCICFTFAMIHTFRMNIFWSFYVQ